MLGLNENGTICTYYGVRSSDVESLTECGKVKEESIYDEIEMKEIGGGRCN